MLFTYLSLKEKGTILHLSYSLQLEMCSTFFTLFITEYVVPPWVYQDHTLELLLFMTFAKWFTLKSYFCDRISVSSYIIYFVIKAVKIHEWGSLFGNNYGYSLDISI